jgi:hypothetical protein
MDYFTTFRGDGYRAQGQLQDMQIIMILMEIKEKLHSKTNNS